MEKIKFEDGQLIKPAYITIDDVEHEVIPAVYEGNTPLSSYNLNRMQKEIIDDGIIVSPTEPMIDRRKVWLKNRKNILPTDFDMWVSGQYNSGTGVAENSTVRVRLNSLLKIQAGETYYFNTFSDFAFIIRTYNKDGVFSRNIGGIENGSTVITNANEEYLGVTLYKPNGTTTYPLYEDYRTLFVNKTIKPMICLDCEDKSYLEYIEPAIYIKNNNGTYEEFIKKEEKRINKIETKISQAETKINTKVGGVKQAWGKELKFNLQSPQQALLLIGNNTIVSCWYSGGGFSYTKIAGVDVSLTTNGNEVTVKLADNAYFTGTAFIF